MSHGVVTLMSIILVGDAIRWGPWLMTACMELPLCPSMHSCRWGSEGRGLWRQRGRRGCPWHMSISQLFSQSFIHSLTHSFKRSFSHSFIQTFIHSFFQELVHSASQSFIESFSHSFIQSLSHSIIHSFDIHSFSHSRINALQSLNQSLNQPVIQSFIHSDIKSFSYSFVRSLIHLFIPSFSISHSFNELFSASFSQSLSHLFIQCVYFLWLTDFLSAHPPSPVTGRVHRGQWSLDFQPLGLSRWEIDRHGMDFLLMVVHSYFLLVPHHFESRPLYLRSPGKISPGSDRLGQVFVVLCACLDRKWPLWTSQDRN